LLEFLGESRDFDGFAPFVEEGADKFLHLLFERGADAEFVIENDFFEVSQSTWEGFEPARGTLEFVGCADVEHEVSVENGDDVVWRNILGEEFTVFGGGATVAADEDVETFFGGDKAETVVLLVMIWMLGEWINLLFVLSFGAFSYATTDTTLQLVRTANTLVSFL